MAKKSKDFQELLREKKYEKDVQENLQDLKYSIQRKSSKSGIEVKFVDRENVEKMSDILEDFVSPFIRKLKKIHQVERFFKLAITVWNLTFLPEELQQLTINKMIETVSQDEKDIQGDLGEIINALVERKKRYFSHVNRIITDFSLSKAGGEYNIAVAYKMVDSND